MFDDSRPGPKPKKKTQPFKAEVLETVPKAPAHLSDGAKAHWPRCAKPLVSARMLCATDIPALCELVEEISAAASMRKRAEADGWAVTQPNGCICKHPLLQDIDRAGKRIAVLFKAMGMTAEGRALLPAVEAPTSPLSAFGRDKFPELREAPSTGRWAYLKPDAAGRIPGKPGYDPETA